MNYNELRKIVSQCVYGSLSSINFGIDMYKLRDRVKQMGLVPVRYTKETKSKMVTPEDIFVLSEYHKEKSRLKWFNRYRSMALIFFVRSKDIDDHLNELLNQLSEDESSEVDKVAILAEIMSEYPCINCCVAKALKRNITESKDTTEISINIRFRANIEMIHQMEYEYRTEDM